MPGIDSSWVRSLFFRKSPITTDLAALVAAVACAGGSGWLGSACDGCSGCVGRRTMRVVVVACCVAGPVGDEYLQEIESIMTNEGCDLRSNVILRTPKYEK